MAKRILWCGVIVFVIMCFFGGCGNGPIAKVRYKDMLYQNGGMGPAFRVSWVDIIQIYDHDAFKKKAQRISDDGCRANLYAGIRGEKSKDGIYYLYDDPAALLASKKWYVSKNISCWLLLTLLLSLLTAIIWPPEDLDIATSARHK